MSTTLPAADAIIRRAFPGIHQEEAEEMVAIGDVRQYPSGAVLCRENAVEETFYVLLDGRVEVTKVINDAEVRVLKQLKAGDFFGEMGLIHNAPRVATVTAMTPITVLEIHKAAFESLLRRSSSMSMAMVMEVSRRLRENDEMAIEDLRLKAGELAIAYQRLAQEELARREFLTTIAHELRIPLTAARGFLEMARFQPLDKEALDDALATVARNLEQIISLVNDILFLQEVELVAPEMHPTTIGELLLQAIEKMRPHAETQGVKLSPKIHPELPPIMGHERSLQRAFEQLLDNAIKFSPQGGEVLVIAVPQGGGVEIAFQDQGIGIDEETLPHIFDRFFHVEKVGEELYGGLGLGLAITRQVIEQHRGTIEVKSRPGEGSTFVITLAGAEADEGER